MAWGFFVGAWVFVWMFACAYEWKGKRHLSTGSTSDSFRIGRTNNRADVERRPPEIGYRRRRSRAPCLHPGLLAPTGECRITDLAVAIPLLVLAGSDPLRHHQCRQRPRSRPQLGQCRVGCLCHVNTHLCRHILLFRLACRHPGGVASQDMEKHFLLSKTEQGARR